MVIEPIPRVRPQGGPRTCFEVQFRPGSYGFRPGHGCKEPAPAKAGDALREVDRLLKATPTWWMPISRVLGYRFQAGRRLVRKKSLMALKDKVRSSRRAAPEATAWDGSSTISTRYCAAGSATSSTRHRASSAPSTASSADGSAQSGASRRRVPASGDAKRITSGGRMPSSLNIGCSPYRPPMHGRDTPDEETSDWRAVCGKTARTVRRAGR